MVLLEIYIIVAIGGAYYNQYNESYKDLTMPMNISNASSVTYTTFLPMNISRASSEKLHYSLNYSPVDECGNIIIKCV